MIWCDHIFQVDEYVAFGRYAIETLNLLYFMCQKKNNSLAN